jgi:hypothetical protein
MSDTKSFEKAIDWIAVSKKPAHRLGRLADVEHVIFVYT